jgi:hypothetical protein
VRHRNPQAEGTEWREVENVEHDGPALGPRPVDLQTGAERPRHIPLDAGWPEATLDWWEAVRTMPHAVLWTRAEWRTARDAAETHARFVEGWKGCSSGSELRQREKQLGMTHDARRDLRIRYVEPKAKPDPAALPANVSRLDDFREL